MRIQQENCEMSEVHQEELFWESFWKRIMEGDNIFIMVFLKENEKYIGNCSFQNVNKTIIEIGIALEKTMQNMGLRTEAFLYWSNI